MTEPAVALSDYALTLEAIVLTLLLQRATGPRTTLRAWFIVFFVSAGIAALCGGTVHGFYLDKQHVGHAILWKATLLATGVTALSTWAIGAEFLGPTQFKRIILAAAFVQLAVFAAIVVLYSDAFWLAIAFNLPAVVFLLVVLVFSYWRYRHSAVLMMAFALVLTLCAAILQQLRVGLHRVYFDHNVVYHLIQAVVLYLLFLGARQLCSVSSLALRGPTAGVNPLEGGGMSTSPGD
jgi:hypothetical protein